MKGSSTVRRHNARTRSTAPSPASKALRSAADAFMALYGASSLAALVLDEHANIVYANPALLAATGWRADEVFGTFWFSRFLEQPADRIRDAFERLLANDPAITVYTIDVLTRYGGTRRIHWQNALVQDGGRIVGSASVGEFIDGPVAEGLHASHPARCHTAYDVVMMARALVDDPEDAALPFVRLVAEQCAQLAEEGGPHGSAFDAAERIRRMFRTTSS